VHNFFKDSDASPCAHFPRQEQAAVILEALKGDYQKALEYMPVYREEYGAEYASPVGHAPATGGGSADIARA